jgi:exodeoxyribonuclease-3
MQLATWNVNSLNVRLPHVLDWLRDNPIDVLCLQETKQEDSKFPYDDLKAAGYNAVHNGQKTYNGVAILSKHTMSDVEHGIAGFEDEQKRVISATINGVRVICVYIVNGQAVDSEKYEYKMRWLEALNGWLAGELQKYPNLVLLGDYNIAPEDRDCHDPAAWIGQILVSPREREAFEKLTKLGLHDDHILVSDALKNKAESCVIDKAPRKLERPSDHTPVILTLSN